MPKNTRSGGLHKGNLFDTNVKATSIDEDIFTDQTLLDAAAADGDLVLVLDVSEDPDEIKYITKTNLLGTSATTLTGSTNNTVVTVTGSQAIAGEANLLFDGTILTNDGGEVDIDISSGDPHLSFQIGGTDKFTLGVDDTDSDSLKIDTGGTVGGATKFTMDSSGNITLAGGLILDGNRSVTPGDGAMLHVDTSTITDSATSGSGTATKYTHVALEAPTLAATNSSVTTSDVATFYINNAATAGSNQTISRNWAMWVDAGNARFDGSIYSGTTHTINSSGLLQVANQSNITGVSTVTSGTWGTGAVIAGVTMTLGSDAEGDVYYRNSSGVLTRLARGSDADVLTLASGVPSWATPTTGDITGVTAGDGLSGGGTSGGVSLALDLNELTGAVLADGDSIAFIDADDNSSKKEAFADILDTIAGTVGTTGLDRSGATLVVTDLHPVGVDGSNNQLLTDDGDGTVSSEAQLTFNGDVLAITGTGSAKGNKDILTITNDVNASDMDGTETSILFNQWYYDGSSPAVADAGRISIGTEQDWTSTGSTQDAYLALETALNGTVTEHIRLTSAGYLGINATDPSSLLDVRGAAGAPGILTLSTAETTVVDGDKLGRIDFQAPKETGTDAILVSASIWAESDVTFDASNNATDLILALGHSEAAAEKFRFTSQNEIGIAGANYGTDGQVLTSGGAGAAVAWEDLATGAVTALNNKTADRLITIGSTTTELDGEANLTYASDVLSTTSSSASLPRLDITNTHADATGAYIKFIKDPGSGQGADNDVMGTITWYGTDASNNTPEELARIESYIVEADHGSEAAGMKFYVAENDATMTAGLQILGQASDDGEIDVTIGAGAASTTTIAGTLTMGSTAAMTNAGLVSVANQSNITGVGTVSSGTWEATDVGVAHGGTGVSTLLTNAVLTGNGASAIQAETDLLFSSNKLIPTASAHNAVGTALTMSAGATTAGTTNNIAGGALTFQGGQGKGSGAGGDIIFQTANAGGSGSSLNALATALTISDDLSITTAGTIELGHASDTTIARSGSGDVTIEGNAIYRAGGTDVPVADGGTGASTLLTNAVLTGNGTSAIQAETDLLFASNKLIPTAAAHDAAGTALTMSAGATTAGTSNNQAGGALTFQGGQGKGSSAGGNIVFQTANAGVSGSSLNALATALTISDDLSSTFSGGVIVGVDDTGHDVKFFGASAGAYMLYDQSEDQLEIRGASADATTSTGKLLLSTALTDINANDVIGKIDFQAPDEAGGTDAITVAASIQAIAQATFTNAVNATDLVFYTGHSEAAAEKIRFTSQNEIGIAGANYGTDGQVLTSGGAGAAVAWEDAGGAVTALNNATENELVTVGSTTTELDAETLLTWNGTQLAVGVASPDSNYLAHFQTTLSSGPAIAIRVEMVDDGTDGPRLFFKHETATNAAGDNDQVAAWNFRFNDYDGTEVEACRFFVNVSDVTAGTVDSEAKWTVKENGADRTGYLSGAGAWTDHSDARHKTYEGTAHALYGGTDGRVITNKLKTLDVGRYYAKGTPADKIAKAERHISPTAQDFYALFGTGTELSGNGGEVTQKDGGKITVDATLAPKDMAGVGLMAIKELIARIETLETEVAALKA